MGGSGPDRSRNRHRHKFFQVKKSDFSAMALVVLIGATMMLLSIIIDTVFDFFFSLCFGLFWGGIIFLVISFISEADEFGDFNVDIDLDLDKTSAPFMLLISAWLIFFGITGMTIYYTFSYYIFFITPSIAFISTKIISYIWKKMSKSHYYKISSTRNLIGKAGEVILEVDKRGGVIKVASKTPMKFEKVHVKPLNKAAIFENGMKVYICDVKEGNLLVDDDAAFINRYYKIPKKGVVKKC